MPLIFCPATSPVVLVMPVTDADPLVRLPVKTTGWAIAVFWITGSGRGEALRSRRAVAVAESVMVLVELLIDRIVVPDGMPVPVMLWPTASPVVLLIPVTDADPLVSVPVKLMSWTNSTVSPAPAVPMKCGVRSLVILSPTIPVSLAGLRRKSVTVAGVVLSIRNVTVLLWSCRARDTGCRPQRHRPGTSH